MALWHRNAFTLHEILYKLTSKRFENNFLSGTYIWAILWEWPFRFLKKLDFFTSYIIRCWLVRHVWLLLLCLALWSRLEISKIFVILEAIFFIFADNKSRFKNLMTPSKIMDYQRNQLMHEIITNKSLR